MRTDATLSSTLSEIYDSPSFAERIKAAQLRVNLDDSEMKEIINQYIEDTPEMFKNLNTAWVKSNHDDIFLYAHSIVGVARILKLDEVSRYAKAVEQMAKERKRSDKETLKLLNEHHNASLEALRKYY
jgi:HPt (histidine-containing phosphotransfer) domain-containing protein